MRASLPEGSPRILTTRRLLLILAALAAAVYAPILAFPFIANSYVEIPVSRVLANWQNLPVLIASPVWHFRWTYVFANSWMVQLFGFTPRPFYAVSICLHVLSVWAVYSTGVWNKLGWKAAAWAAAFFAVYEGHQGAVAFLSDWPDVFVTLFGCACFVLWVRWLEGGRWPVYVLAGLAFAGAVFSKESGWVMACLLALPVILEKRLWIKRSVAALIPFLLAAAVYVATIAMGMRWNPHGYDGALSAPVVAPGIVFGRPWPLLFVCGLAAAGYLLWHWREHSTMVAASFAWMVLALAPYAFWAFLQGEPSGQTYLASVGLAWLAGVALADASGRIPVPIVALIALAIGGANVGFLWTKKHRESLQLAAPTEALINAAPYSRGPLQLTCFPYAVQIAVAAVRYAGGDLIIDGTPKQVEKPHCVSFHYKDMLGNVREVIIRSAI